MSTLVNPEKTDAATLQLALDALLSGDFQQRWEVAKILPRFGKLAIAPLVALLGQPELDLELRWFCARILGESPDQAALLALAQLLSGETPEELRRVASDALAKMGESAISPLIDLLKDPQTRLLSVQALAQIRRPGIIEPLLSVGADASSQVRAIALEALGSFREERILAVLVQGLEDQSILVRKEALQALAYWSSATQKLVPLIAPLLSDSHPEISQQAALTLGRLASPEAAAALAEVLSRATTPLSLQQEIVRSLGWMEIPQALDYLATSLETATLPLAEEILTILGRQSEQHTEKAIAILNHFFHSPSPLLNNSLIKQSLATALGQLRHPLAQVPLQHLAQDSDASVRLHAQAALRKIPLNHVSKSSFHAAEIPNSTEQQKND